MGDVTDPSSWIDQTPVTPPADYVGGAYQYASHLTTSTDATLPIVYTGNMRAFIMGIPWQYVPGVPDLGASLDVSLDGGASWINNLIAPAGHGQTLSGVLYVNLNSAQQLEVTVSRPLPAGTGTAIESADVVAGTGGVTASGIGYINEPYDVVSGGSGSTVIGSGTISESADTVSGAGATKDTGSGSPVEGTDVVSGAGAIGVAGTGIIPESSDVAAGSGATQVSGSGAASEATDVVAGTGFVGATGFGGITESADVVAGSGTTKDTGSGAIAESADVVAGNGAQTDTGSGAISEGADVVAGTGTTKVSGSGAMAEAHDVVAGSGVQTDYGSGTPTEAHDVMSGVGTVVDQGSGALSETHDTVTGSGSTLPNTFVVGWAHHATGGGDDYYGANTNSSVNPVTFGSIVSSSIGWGTAISAYTDHIASTGHFTTVLAVSASSNPGQSIFSTMSATVNGTPKSLNSSAASYGYIGGIALWTWSLTDFWSGGVVANDTVTLS